MLKFSHAPDTFSGCERRDVSILYLHDSFYYFEAPLLHRFTPSGRAASHGLTPSSLNDIENGGARLCAIGLHDCVAPRDNFIVVEHLPSPSPDCVTELI